MQFSDNTAKIRFVSDRNLLSRHFEQMSTSVEKETLMRHSRGKRPSSHTFDDIDSHEEPKNDPKKRKPNNVRRGSARTSAQHQDTVYDKGIVSSRPTSERDQTLIVAIDGGKADGYDHSTFRRRMQSRSIVLADWLKTGEQCTVLFPNLFLLLYRLIVSL